MDANGTRYHLLLGRDDWLRCRTDGAPPQTLLPAPPGGKNGGAKTVAPETGVVWDDERKELTLQPLLFQFTAAPKDVPPTMETRRGAARDRYDNWYWIDETGRKIRVLSEGSRRVSDFWPADEAAAGPSCPPDAGAGDFRARERAVQPPALEFRGLAVTEDHYLVVGVLEPAGLVVFDLHAGGTPEQIIWPARIPFEPFDMAAAPGGGVLILDRKHKRFWSLDRHLNVVADNQRLATLREARVEDFQPRAGGPERVTAAREFPEGVALEDATPVAALDPVAIDCAPDGTVYVLDRAPGVPEGEEETHDEAGDGEQPDDEEEDSGEEGEEDGGAEDDAADEQADREEGEEGESAEGEDFFALSLPGGSRMAGPDARKFARVFRYRAQRQAGAPASVGEVAELVVGKGAEEFELKGHDLAYVAAHTSEGGAAVPERLYVVSENGNQTFAFALADNDDGDLVLRPLADYLPMRLFAGRALVRADASLFYDYVESWIPLVEQRRPRYTSRAFVMTPLDATPPSAEPEGGGEPGATAHAFDGREPDCVWHRLMLDACIPPETEVLVSSRAANDEAELALAEWQPEPNLYLRGGGSELPYATAAGERYGTWELLFQQARGRFLQLRLELRGNGRTTPRLRALRAYYPRFSYLERYLPAVYREDAQSASFLDRFLSNFEGLYTSTEDRVAAAQMLFDVRSAPADALDWLAGWFGAALDPAWDERRRRLFIKNAARLFQMRGTIRGIQSALRLSLDDCPDDSIFDDTKKCCSSSAARGGGIRIVEKFRTRRTPAVVLGDPTEAGVPRLVASSGRWSPDEGGAALGERYSRVLREGLGERRERAFPLHYPGGRRLTLWRQFALSALGFEPSAGFDERRRWQQFLCRRYSKVAAVNAAHGSDWHKLSRVFVPRGVEQDATLLGDWRDYVAETSSLSRRKWWQDFLARRYRSVRALNDAYGTNWPSFELIPLPDRLPADGRPLVDWYQFEGVALQMRLGAHRFTVLLPLPASASFDTEEQRRRLQLADRIVRVEKPAHTVFDIKLYWALFRIGEARLGEDTLLDVGSRAPQLMSPMVLGEEYLAQSYLAPTHPQDVADRQSLGHARIS
ncbi:MAG TPA: phage tail protein [Pyrinomonadaceae bacterium]|nr:phage tail protein [Pyrinomonadaceae bacterium]